MTVPVEQLSIKTTTSGGTVALGSTKAALGDRLGQIINVKTDFGAAGNGSTDDTAAIQAALDAAFGPYASPHGSTNASANVPVYFPAGTYKVTSPIAGRAVTGASTSSNFTFYLSSPANATIGATYTNNGITFTVAATITGASQLAMTATAGSLPLTSGTLTKTSGTGDATITFSAWISVIRLTVSTTGIATGDWVVIAGVGGTTEANGSWFVTVVDATHLTLDQSTFSNAFVSNGTLTTPALRVRDVLGGHIFGNGRESTIINCITSGGICFQTDGMGFSKVENLGFAAPTGPGVSFELNWNNNARAGAQSTQSNTFFSCDFGGGCDYSVRIGGAGNNGFMSSENTFLNCYVGTGAVAGYYTGNYNALQQSIIGGNIAACGYGIYNATGSTPTILGVGLQLNTIADIYIANSGTPGGDTYFIGGCRSESTSTFLQLGSSLITAVVSACSLGAPATIMQSGGANRIIFEGCGAGSGVFATSQTTTQLILKNCLFSDPNFMGTFAGNAQLENIQFGTPIFFRRTASQKRNGSSIRTYQIEAAALTDSSFLYEGDDNLTVTVSIAAPGVIDAGSPHGFAANTPVAFVNNGDTLPTGLSLGVTYYVKTPLANTFNLSLAAGGAAITTTGSQSGTHKLNVVRTYARGDNVLKTNVASGGSPGWFCTTAGIALADTAAVVAVFRAAANVA